MTLARLKQIAVAAIFACLWLLPEVQAAPTNAVRVTLRVDASRLKVGQTTTLHAYAQIIPDFEVATEQIFAWFVDLLNSAPSVMEIQPGTLTVSESNSDPATSSRGTAVGPNIRAIYDTFLGTTDAGKDEPIELFSVTLKAVGVGTSVLTMAKGTTATALEKDFIVSTPGGSAIFGGLYDEARLEISSFLNTPPTLDPVPDAEVNELSLITFTLVGHDPDPGQILTYSFVGSGLFNSSVNPLTGVFTWTPVEAHGPRVIPIQFRVTDNGTPPLSATNEVIITVNEVNRPPSVQAPANVTSPELAPITAKATATDPDVLAGQTPSTNRLSFSLVNAPEGAAIDPVTGSFTWTPTEAQAPGSYLIRVVAIDDGEPQLAGTNTFTITLTEVNVAPVLPAPPSQTVAESTPLTFAFAATDADLPANQLTYNLLSAPPGVVLDPATGVISWTPTEAQGPGTYQVQVSVSDNAPTPRFATNQASITVTEVNAAPVLAVLQDRAVNEVTPLSFTVTATDVDLPAQTLTYSLENPPAGASINAQSGAFTWTPTEAQGPGIYTVVVRVTDNGSPAHADAKSFDVTVREANAAPVVNIPAGQSNLSAPELAPLVVQLTAVDTDLPPDLLTFSLLNPPAGAQIDSATGRLTWTPSESQGPGVYDLVVVATDNKSPALSGTNTVRVSVTEVNVAPVIAPIDSRTIPELTQLSIPISATDSDLPAQTLAYSLLNPPARAAINPTTGLFTWTPNEAQGPGQFTISVRVAETGAAGLAATNTFSVTVTEVNSAPVVNVPAPLTRSEVLPISQFITVTDSDVLTGQNPNVNRITYSLLDPPQGAAINPDTGQFTWSPTEAQGPGSYTIRVVALDNGVPPLSGTNSYFINLTEANRDPVIVAPADQTVQELTLLTATFLAADSDLPTNSLTFSIVNAPPGVAVNPTNGIVTWTPTEAQGPGSYTISVAVSDNAVSPLRATNSFNVTVTEKNLAPVIADITDKTVAELATLTIPVNATDPDIPSVSLTYSLETAPSGAAINPTTGMFTWTPGAGLGPGDYIIGVKVTETGATGMSDTKTFRVSVVKPVTVQPRLKAISLAAGGFTLELTGEAGASYTLEYSTNISTLANWSTLTTLSLGAGQTVRTFLDATHILGAANPKGFFRVKAAGGVVTPPNSPTLKAVSVVPGGVNLRLTGDPNTQFRIEYSTNLPNWTPLTSITIPVAGTIDYLDTAHLPGTTAGTRGFYRAVNP